MKIILGVIALMVCTVSPSPIGPSDNLNNQTSKDLVKKLLQLHPGIVQKPLHDIPDIGNLGDFPSTARPLQVHPDLVQPTSQVKPDLAQKPLKDTPDLVQSTLKTKPDLVQKLLKDTPDLVQKPLKDTPDLVQKPLQADADAVLKSLQENPDAVQKTLQENPDLVQLLLKVRPDLKQKSCKDGVDVNQKPCKDESGMSPDVHDSYREQKWKLDEKSHRSWQRVIKDMLNKKGIGKILEDAAKKTGAARLRELTQDIVKHGLMSSKQVTDGKADRDEMSSDESDSVIQIISVHLHDRNKKVTGDARSLDIQGRALKADVGKEATTPDPAVNDYNKGFFHRLKDGLKKSWQSLFKFLGFGP